MKPVRYGQHFLQNTAVIDRIIKHAKVASDDVILEVGPGKGILTRALASSANHVVCVEIDKKLVDDSSLWLLDNISIINADILQVDLSKLRSWNKCVSNLPYQISSPFLFRLLQYSFDLAVLMFQKDFAQRLTAQPNTSQYSRLTVHLYYFATCELLETVAKTQFVPQPKVDSMLVRILPRAKPPFVVYDEELFFSLTTQLFNHRRKTIGNGLVPLLGSQAKTVQFADKRVEQLTPEEIGMVCNEVSVLLKRIV